MKKKKFLEKLHNFFDNLVGILILTFLVAALIAPSIIAYVLLTDSGEFPLWVLFI